MSEVGSLHARPNDIYDPIWLLYYLQDFFLPKSIQFSTEHTLYHSYFRHNIEHLNFNAQLLESFQTTY